MAKKKEINFKKYIKPFWTLFLVGFTTILLIFLFASWGVFGELPTFEELENPEKNLATEVISSDGVTLGKYAFKNRTPVGFKDLSDNIVKALIATEDERFYEHSGVDFKASLRAVIKMGKDGGGSTITQQFAKLLFHGEGSKNIVQRIGQKFKEYVIAIKLERQYTKEEIITMYFNIYDYGNNAEFELTTSAGHTGSNSAKLLNYGQAAGNFDELVSSTPSAYLRPRVTPMM